MFNNILNNKDVHLLRAEIEKNQDKILSILSTIEPLNIAQQEVLDSIKTLETLFARDEFFVSPQFNFLVSYQPSNLPLYSLILYVVVPSFFFKKGAVYIPQRIRGLVLELSELLRLEEIFPTITFTLFSKDLFTRAFSSEADVVIYTGRPENVKKIMNTYADTFVIYNGYGVNPFVVDVGADVSFAVNKLVEMRLYNSGQDCTAPDVIYVSEKVYNIFLDALVLKLDSITVGTFSDSSVSVGPIMYEKTFKDISLYVQSNKDNLLYEGLMNYENRIIGPHVFDGGEYNVSDYREFFGPIFLLKKFPTIMLLCAHLIKDKVFQENSMYISYFGDAESVDFGNPIVLTSQNVIDIEDGNKPFGGYGEKANFIYDRVHKESLPIYIPEVLQSWAKQCDKLHGTKHLKARL